MSILMAAALCLTGAGTAAEEGDFSEIAGVWYTEEIMLNVTEDGRFVLELFDGDWTGSLKAELQLNEDDEECVVYRMILDDPKLSIWEDLELAPDAYHPGKMLFFRDGALGEIFYDVPVYIMDLTGDDPDVYGPYAFVDDAQGEEPAVTMMFTLLRPATDIAVLKMFDQEIDEDGNLGYNGDVLEWWPELDSQERIVVTHVFQGDLPDLAFSFLAEDGTRYDFAVQISGADGELILWPLLPSEG